MQCMLPYSDSFYSAYPMFVGILWNSGYCDRAYRDSAMRKTRPTRMAARHWAAERHRVRDCNRCLFVFFASTPSTPRKRFLLLLKLEIAGRAAMPALIFWRLRCAQDCPMLLC